MDSHSRLSLSAVPTAILWTSPTIRFVSPSSTSRAPAYSFRIHSEDRLVLLCREYHLDVTRVWFASVLVPRRQVVARPPSLPDLALLVARCSPLSTYGSVRMTTLYAKHILTSDNKATACDAPCPIWRPPTTLHTTCLYPFSDAYCKWHNCWIFHIL
jgi:hypothetical protein